MNACPDAPGLDVYLAGTSKPLISNIFYTNLQSEQLSPGSYAFEIRLKGALPTSPPIATISEMAFARSETANFVVAGLALSKDEGDRARIIALDTRTGNGGGDVSYFRFVNALSDGPALSADVGRDGSLEVQDLPRFGVSPPPGVRSLLKDWKDRLTPVALWAGPRAFSFSFGPKSGVGAFAVVMGRVAGRQMPEVLLVHGAMELGKAEPVVQLLHAVPGAPTLDAFIGPTKVASGLAFGGLSNPVPIGLDGVTVEFFPAAASTERPAGAPLAMATVNGFGREDSVFVLGEGQGIPASFSAVSVNLPDESSGAPAGSFANDSSGTPTLALSVQGSAMKTAAVPFRTSIPSRGVVLPVGPTVLELRSGSDSSLLATFETSFASKQQVVLISAGVLAPSAGQPPLQLLVVDVTSHPWTITSLSRKP